MINKTQNSKLKTQNLELVAVLLGFAALTVIMTWPAVTLFGRGINAFGDVVVQMTTMTWDAHALVTNPLGIFEAPAFYPYAHSNAYSEHLIGETLIALPLFWISGGDPAPAHNFNFLLSFVLTGGATYLLVRDLTGHRVAAVAAGIAYTFAGYRFAQSGHMQTLATEWFPLTLWALRRGLRAASGPYLALAAACVVGMGLFSVYYLFFLALLVALYGAWWLLAGRRAETDRSHSPSPYRGGESDLGSVASYSGMSTAITAADNPKASVQKSSPQGGEGRVRGVSHLTEPVARADNPLSPSPLPPGERASGPHPGNNATVPVSGDDGNANPPSQYRKGGRGVRSRPAPLWLKAGLAAAAAGLILLPLYWPYVQVNQELGFNRSTYEVQGWAADPRFFVNVLATNWLWATFIPRMVAQGGERELFPGLIITLLAVVGVLAGKRVWATKQGASAQHGTHNTQHTLPDLHERWFYLILAGAAVLLTFGLSVRLFGVDVPLPYAALYDWVPGFSALRVPVRFVALLNLALAVLGGYGLAAILTRRRARWTAALWLPLLALMLLEYVQVRDLSNNRDMRPPAAPAYTYLAAHPGPLIELPMHGDSQDVWYTYWDTYDWQPLMDGFSSFVPPGTVEVAHAMSTFPDPPNLALLQGLQVQHVLIHFGAYSASDQAALKKRLAASPALTEVFNQNGDAIYAVAADPWPGQATRALPPDGYLWLGRGSTGGVPALETLAYALKYNRLRGAPLPIPTDHVAGDVHIGYRALPALPFGQAADVALAPAGDPAGGAGSGAGQAFYSNALATLYRRDPGLLAHYDLAAPLSPYAPHGLALPPGGVGFAPPGTTPGSAAHYASLLFAAFASTYVTVESGGMASDRITLAPGLTRYQTPPGASGPLDLRLAAPDAGVPPVLLSADVYAAENAPPGGQTQALTDTLLLDLLPSTVDTKKRTITTAWRAVSQHPGGGQFTLTLDIYQKPFGTHPNGHLGSWSLPLPAGDDGRSFALTLDPVAKTATATLNGGSTPVYAWQGPPTTGDFTASLLLGMDNALFVDLPVYDFTLDGGRITDFSPAPGTVVRLPFAAP